MVNLVNMANEFDLLNLDEAFYENPFDVYMALREHEPVKKIGKGTYFLSRYADCVQVYNDTKSFSSDKKLEFGEKYGNSPLFDHHTTSLVFNDPPLHTRVRKLILGALLPRAISAMEPGLHKLIDSLFEQMDAKEKAGGTVDLIGDFACAIPIEIIGNLLGVPAGEREPLRDWSLAILGALEPKISDEQFQRGNNAVVDFLSYLEKLVDDRRKNPGDSETDILTRLIEGEVDGEKLSNNELLQNCIFLLNAGHETTTNIIGNSLEILGAHPEWRKKLIDKPDIMRTAIEEFLRFQSPNQLGNRITTCNVNVGGVELPAGTKLTLCIGAANRDPEKFENPNELDLMRMPNRHLAFAGGAHQCAGMNVARLETRIAVARILERYPEYALLDDARRGRRARFRGFEFLPVRLKG